MSSLDAVFARDAAAFVPLAAAKGPWNALHLHGGPVLGLFAHALEQHTDNSGLRLARLTTDLHSPVPAQPLHVRIEEVRRSRRLWLLQATISTDAAEVARATALYLHPSEGAMRACTDAQPPGPEGLDDRPLLDASRWPDMPTGFHTAVQTRWVPRDRHTSRAIWFRMPLAFVAGVATSPSIAACALADFAAAAASIDGGERGTLRTPYINTDSTLYLSRPPQGEWFCMAVHQQSEHAGINVIHVDHFDHLGHFGASMQARLAHTSARPR